MDRAPILLFGTLLSLSVRRSLLTACRGFTMYSSAFVACDAERLTDEDLDRARALRLRARRL